MLHSPMFHLSMRGACLSALLLLGVFALLSNTAQAGDPVMFRNYYVGPSGYGGGVAAQAYVSPLPTPPLVGRTYITYSPLSPHEFLYHHKRTYYRYCRNGGFTTTHVRWW